MSNEYKAPVFHELLADAIFERIKLCLETEMKAGFEVLEAKMEALEAKMEALVVKIEKPGAFGQEDEDAAVACPAGLGEDAPPPARAVGAFGHLPVLEQHRMQQRGSDY
jgi:hypothetical protein